MMLRFIEAGDGPFEGTHAVDIGVETTRGERINARLFFGKKGFAIDNLIYQRTVESSKVCVRSLSDLDCASLEARDWVVSMFGIETGIEEEEEMEEDE